MKPVKRKTPTVSSISASSDVIQLEEKRKILLYGNISLLAASYSCIGGIFIHRSAQDQQNHTLAYPLRVHNNKSARRSIREIRKQKGGK